MSKEAITAAKLELETAMDNVKRAKLDVNDRTRRLNAAVAADPTGAAELGITARIKRPRTAKPAEAPKASKSAK